MDLIARVSKNISFFLVLGIVLGIALGLILGPRVEIFTSFENAFNMFLQTIIVLYIPLSLMHGLGNLQPKEAGRLLFKAISFLLALWGIMILCCYLGGLFVPKAHIAVVTPAASVQGLLNELSEYLIPRNPFYDIIQNILPPLALFSLILGTAFMYEKTKEPLLGLLQGGTHILETMMVWLMIISPIKAVLHFAVLAGTVDFETLHPVIFYVVVIVIICLFLSLVFLPLLVSLLTPLKYTEVMRRFAFVGLASFGTGQPLIAFPFIAEALRKIRLEYHFPLRDWRATYLLIAPLAFSFAQLGNLLALFFAEFFSFFFHTPLTIGQQIILPIFAIVLSIGSPSSSLQNLFMIAKQISLPEQATLFLYELRHIIVSFKVLLSTTGVLSLIILVMMLHEKKLKKITKTLIPLCAGSVFVLSSCFFIARLAIDPKDDYSQNFRLKKLQDVLDTLPVIKIATYPTEEERAAIHPVTPILNNILAKGRIRVGYDPQSPPYAYFNKDGQIAGFDIAFMAKLASELNVEMDLIPIRFDRIEEDLNLGVYDIAVGGIVMDLVRLKDISFSDFYEKEENYLMSLKSDYEKYTSLSDIKRMKDLRIGARGAYVRIAKNLFPLATVIDNMTWLDVIDHNIDLFLENARSNYLRALEYPQLVCLDFGPDLGLEYLSFAMGQQDLEWKNFINEWLSLKKLSGFYDDQQDYWFYTRGITVHKKRWNLLDTLLQKDR